MYKSHKLAQEPHRKEETHNFKNPFTTVCFFFSPLYFKHYATVPMVIFWAWATRDYTRLKTPSLRCVFVAK